MKSDSPTSLEEGTKDNGDCGLLVFEEVNYLCGLFYKVIKYILLPESSKGRNEKRKAEKKTSDV